MHISVSKFDKYCFNTGVVTNCSTYHKDLKCKDIIIPVAPCSTNEEVAYLVEQINYIQPVLEKEGMQLHFHNHSKEFIPNKDGQLVEEI